MAANLKVAIAAKRLAGVERFEIQESRSAASANSRPKVKCALSAFQPTAMRASQFFIATLKEAPSEAEIVSHKLMLRAGLIRRLAGGIYTLSLIHI